MVTAANLLGSNKALQEHWIKRLVAIIIDGLIVFIPLYFIFNIIFWTIGFWFGYFWWMFEGLFFFLYFVILEMMMQSSIGKKIVNLQVVTTTGQPLGIGAIFIRNLFKIIGPLILLDVLLGWFTEGDPRQRFMDRVANTVVVRNDAQAYVEEQFRQMQVVPPHPTVAPGAWGQPGQQQAPPGSQQPTTQPPPGGWPAGPQGAWQPGQGQPPQGQWPQHQWDEKGQLKPPTKFCSSCGGELQPRGDGKMTCVRCGLVY
jgi:uncharacterized RDD family membrane protein YckC